MKVGEPAEVNVTLASHLLIVLFCKHNLFIFARFVGSVMFVGVASFITLQVVIKIWMEEDMWFGYLFFHLDFNVYALCLHSGNCSCKKNI